MSTVAVIDYGGSNLRSVVNALEFVARERHRIFVSDESRGIREAERGVFPGQGALGDCMERLAACNLTEVVCDCARTRPFLGICLGLQSLMPFSEEDGGTEGLGLFAGRVVRFPARPAAAPDGSPRKVPHMGWNQVEWAREHPVTASIATGTRFYFVHSYYVVPKDGTLTLGSTEYIRPFTAALASGFVFATQFHPEKSAAAGLMLLENFLAWNGGV